MKSLGFKWVFIVLAVNLAQVGSITNGEIMQQQNSAPLHCEPVTYGQNKQKILLSIHKILEMLNYYQSW